MSFLKIHFFVSLHPALRIVVIILVAAGVHFLVRELRLFTQWVLSRKIREGLNIQETFARRYPKAATLMTILVSATVFIIYFMAVGLVLKEFRVSLTAYLASASVIGLAIGFGSQGLVQDVVIGLTLIFSDALNIEDIVDISGQVGKVENIGLRFTTLVNLHGQKVFIPNRNINIIGRFRNGYIRAYVDVQIPDEVDREMVTEKLRSIAAGMYSQHGAIILAVPEILGVRTAGDGNWQYQRIKFHLWPGQGPLIETTFKQRLMAAMKKDFPDYSDWMISITYKAS